jgi:hypothetical protein
MLLLRIIKTEVDPWQHFETDLANYPLGLDRRFFGLFIIHKEKWATITLRG